MGMAIYKSLRGHEFCSVVFATPNATVTVHCIHCSNSSSLLAVCIGGWSL